MNRINIKPLSVNECWQGKRFKTSKYLKYERDVLLTLKPIKMPNAPYSVKLIFGLSNKMNDVDNGCKPILDILQKKYGFNDRDIYHLEIEKKIVKKSEEYFEFEIKSLTLH